MNTNGCERIEELVPKVVDRQALDWEVEAVEAHLAACAGCAALRDDLLRIGSLVRRDVAAAVEAADFSSLWAAVEKHGPRRRRAGRRRIRRTFFSWTAFSRLAAAAAVAAAFAWAVLLPGKPVHEFSSDNHIEVSSVEGGANNTVMIYESAEDNVTFIWVIDETYEERAL